MECAKYLREEYHNELLAIAADLSHFEALLTQAPTAAQVSF